MGYQAKRYKETSGGGRLRALPAAVFLAFIFLMALIFLFSKKTDYSSNEKRFLEEFPETTLEEISSGRFGEGFERYFADHFPSRNLWVGINAYYSLLTGNNGASGVYRCSGGYLINTPVSQKNRLSANVETILEFREKTDLPLYAVLIPSTGYIVSDVLPAGHEPYRDDRYLSEISERLAHGGVSFADLREPFKAAYGSKTQLYYRTDHHLTTAGAYEAYLVAAALLGKDPVPKSAFKTDTYYGFYGTTYSTSGFWLTEPDSIDVWRDPASDSSVHIRITDGNTTKEADSLFFYDHLREDDKYPVFIDGNHALTEITNERAPEGTLLMIKDSFSHAIAPFLAENYRKIILVDLRYYKASVSELCEQKKPDQILFLYGIDNFLTDSDLAWLN